MSQERDAASISEEVSSRLSASRDGELDAVAEHELSDLITRSPDVAARAAEFAEVDAALKALGDRTISETRSDRMLGEFESRRAGRRASSSEDRAAIIPLPVYWVAAAAAVFVLAFFGARGLGGVPSLDPAEAPDFAEQGPNALPVTFDTELVQALGFLESDSDGVGADELAELAEEFLGLAPSELEMIEELETLEYLAARDAGGRG